MLNNEEINRVLADVAKVVPYTLRDEDGAIVTEWDDQEKVWLDVMNSSYGRNRLDAVFCCGPSPYTNVVAMVKSTCMALDMKVPRWFTDKYLPESQFVGFGEEHRQAVSRLKHLAQELARVCARDEVNEIELRRLGVLQDELEMAFPAVTRACFPKGTPL